MSMMNALCPAQQAKAVMDLIMEDPERFTKNETVIHALFSVQENLSRVLNAIDEALDEDQATMEVLCKMGILHPVLDELNRGRRKNNANEQA